MLKRYKVIATMMIVLALVAGCGKAEPASTPTLPAAGVTPASTAAPAEESATPPLSEAEGEAATLGSLEQVDDYPLYTMHYYGAYDQRASSAGGVTNLPRLNSTWACSLFAALGDADNVLYGRNFDWEYSPALLLSTDPPDGYASVSMVDIAYLGFGGARASTLTDLPLAERRALLDAPFLPFDGMNERGMVIGMAAVPPGEMHPDPDKESIGSLMVIREILDHASNVDEAVAILQSYNIDVEGGPPVHYLIADPSGRSALIEFYQGEMVVIPNESGTDWHLATNFLRASVGESAEGQCWRYDTLNHRLAETKGRITTQGAMDLLEEVSQESTQWSVVYDTNTGDVNVAMGREYDNVHTLCLRETLASATPGPPAEQTAPPATTDVGTVNSWAVLAQKDDYSDVDMTDILVDYIGIAQMRQVLEDSGWNSDHIHELPEFDRETLQDELDWLEENADEDDVVFLYVASHGRYLRDVLLWGEFFAGEWEQTPSHRRLLVIDSCQAANYTGAVSGDPSPHLSIAAVARDEYGWAGIEEEGLPIIGGVFTHYFAAAFDDPKADTDDDGLVSVQEAALMAEEQQRTYMHKVVFAVPEFVAMYHDIGVFPDQDPAFPHVVVDDTIGEPLYLALDAYPAATASPNPGGRLSRSFLRQ